MACVLISLIQRRYFGRAKELPGVRELFQSRKREEEEENQAQSYYKKFINQGPVYFGDLDEVDGKLLLYERQVEDNGLSRSHLSTFISSPFLEWEDACLTLRGVLGLPTDEPIPELSRGVPPSFALASAISPAPKSKRKADGSSDDHEIHDQSTEPSKRPKTNASTADPMPESASDDVTQAHAQAAAAYITFLNPRALMPPKMPTREEMQDVLLQLRKKALVQEYFGDEGS